MVRRNPIGHLATFLIFACTSTACAADDASEKNEMAYNAHCRPCHSFAKDDNRLGPTLHAVIGRKAGSEKGFAYSDSVRNSGVTWDDGTLDRFIANPNAVIAGNNMGTVYSGITDASIRAQIIAFLRNKSDTSTKK